MIKLLKLQKAVYVIITGIVLSFLYWILEANNLKGILFLKVIAGAFLMIGAFWFLYPILFAKDDGSGKVEIITDPALELLEDKDDELTAS